MTAPSIVQASQLHFQYPDHPLFDNLNLSIPAGVTFVRGGDGRGKTSLLKLLAGELQARSGQLAINGIRLDQQPTLYRQQVYYVDPRTEEFDQLSVPDYLATVQAKFTGFDAARVPALLEGLSLLPHVEKKLFMLSTGSKRKVYLAGAFAAGAAVNLLDDPFAGLDRSAIHFVCDTLNAFAGQSTQAWIASFYEVPEQITALATIDLGD
jgi:ABC-type multidrug transport system ATPase subunit